MKVFKDKVAIVTGAAGSIGRAMAERFATEGIKVVLADVEQDALLKAETEMKANGATVLAVHTDISKNSGVELLAQKTLDAFDAVDILCNNAGVISVGGAIWENTIADWEWLMGVNLWGVIHGIRVFVPIMLRQDTEGHIVNTASIAGLVSPPFSGLYNVTKHAVVTLSETLHQQLMHRASKLRVSVLCPSFVNTQLMDSDRNRPAELQNNPIEEMITSEAEIIQQFYRHSISTGIPPEQVADCVFNSIIDERFYIFPHPEAKELVRIRMSDIFEESNLQSIMKVYDSRMKEFESKCADRV
jgi:NADP-dependent 3-hydroxy acid dehydrogenase YdfG